MTRTEGHFTGRGGLRLIWQAWLPDGDLRAVVVLAHGYGEHAGRYGNLVDRLVARGLGIYAVDHRGHGRSEGPRGHVDRFGDFVADLHALRVRVGEEHRGRPLFLLGHSLGGLIAIHYLLAHGSEVAGAVLSSPALGLVDPPGWARALLARILSRVAPRTAFDSALPPEHLSRDPAVGAAYAADPLVHHRATARFYVEFLRAIATAQARAKDVTLPILVQQAGQDRLVDVAGTERFGRRLAATDKTIRVYPELYHEVYNETPEGRAEVFRDLEAWLESHLATASRSSSSS